MIKFKSIVIVYWLLVITGVAGGFLMLTGWSYPIQQVSKPTDECKSVRREDMPSGCSIDLPRIKGGNSEQYRYDELYPMIYTSLRGGSYTDSWDIDNGSSPGIDIATSKGTPVNSIADGTVVQVGFRFGIGNSITVRHLYNGGFIYSSYSHLDEMYVSMGDLVTEGQQIGKVGNTGTTFGQYGNHLDFQLTTTSQEFYPYSYRDCNAGLSYYDIVNSVMCRSFMEKNTVDPIKFIESQGSLNISTSNTRTNQFVKSPNPKLEKAAISHGSAPVQPTLIFDSLDKKTTSTSVVKPTSISITQESVSELDLVRDVVNYDSLQYHIIGLNPQEEAQVKRSFIFFIKIYDATSKQLIKGVLDDRIVIRDSKGIIAFSTPVVSHTNDGVIEITALGLKSGYTTLSVEIAGQELGSYGITLK